MSGRRVVNPHAPASEGPDAGLGGLATSRQQSRVHKRQLGRESYRHARAECAARPPAPGAGPAAGARCAATASASPAKRQVSRSGYSTRPTVVRICHGRRPSRGRFSPDAAVPTAGSASEFVGLTWGIRSIRRVRMGAGQCEAHSHRTRERFSSASCRVRCSGCPNRTSCHRFMTCSVAADTRWRAWKSGERADLEGSAGCGSGA